VSLVLVPIGLPAVWSLWRLLRQVRRVAAA